MDINVKSAVYTRNIGGNSTETAFNFYTNLRTIDKLRFVNNVTNLIVNENAYNPILFDLMFDFEIVDIFTDIDTSEMNDSADTISAIEDFLTETNIVEIVIANVEDGLIGTLRKAINDNIAYRTGIHRNELSDAITRLIETLTKKINGIDTDGFMQMAEKVSQLTGDITPEKIINAYAKTDVFKQNQQERVQALKEHMRELDQIGKIGNAGKNRNVTPIKK